MSNLNGRKILKLYFFVSIVPALLMLMLLFLALRYRGEFYAVLIFSSMVGIAFLQNAFSKKKIFIIAFLITLMAFVLVVNGLFAERSFFHFVGAPIKNSKAVDTWFGVPNLTESSFHNY